MDDGDEIVCLRVVDKDAKISSDKSLGRKEYQDEAKQLMNAIQAKNDDNRAISIVLEFAVGKVHTTFQKMVSLLRPGHSNISLRHVITFSSLLTKLTHRFNSTNLQCSLSVPGAAAWVVFRVLSAIATLFRNGACNIPQSLSWS